MIMTSCVWNFSYIATIIIYLRLTGDAVIIVMSCQTQHHENNMTVIITSLVTIYFFAVIRL